jgi:hypothetical protein
MLVTSKGGLPVNTATSDIAKMLLNTAEYIAGYCINTIYIAGYCINTI